MKIDIEGMLEAAIFLDREEEDLCQWEIKVEGLSLGLGEAEPVELAQRSQSLAALQTDARTLAALSVAVRDKIAEHQGHGVHPDVRPAVERQTQKATELERRSDRLRRRMVDLSLELGSIIRSLHDERTEDALLRLFANLHDPLTEQEIAAGLADDLADVDAAMGSWRHTQGDKAPGDHRRTRPRKKVSEALVHLEAQGLAVRLTRPLRNTRWTIRSNRLLKAA